MAPAGATQSMVTKIRTVLAQEILDCWGSPTVFATVVLQNGSSGSASVPSRASVGSGEAFELRDRDPSYQDDRPRFCVRADADGRACLAPKLPVAFSSAA